MRPTPRSHRVWRCRFDAWIAKLKSEQVTFLEGTYPLGDTRAAMIEGPSREALDLVEAK